MTTATATRTPVVPLATRRPGLAETMRSEFIKIRSVRSTYWTLLAQAVAAIAFAGLNCAGIVTHVSQNGGINPAAASLNGQVGIGELIIVVLGALVLTSEYSTGMIRTSLAVMPRRGVLYAAKAMVFTAVSLAVSLVASFVHDAAADQPVPYTPVCETGSDAFEVCVHPAYRMYLSQTESLLAPAIAEIAGLPGAPARAEEVAGTALPESVAAGALGIGYVTGSPPVYEFSFNNAIPITGQDPAAVRSLLQQDVVDAFITGPLTQKATAPSGTQAVVGPQDPAQIAVVDGLLAAMNWKPPPGQGQGTVQPVVRAASARFAALPAPVRHAWLGAHLTALRAGRISAAQIP